MANVGSMGPQLWENSRPRDVRQVFEPPTTGRVEAPGKGRVRGLIYVKRLLGSSVLLHARRLLASADLKKQNQK